jgi:hypothetical protein
MLPIYEKFTLIKTLPLYHSPGFPRTSFCLWPVDAAADAAHAFTLSKKRMT